MNTQWKVDADTINHSFVRFAIPITWDFAEGNPIGGSAGPTELCKIGLRRAWIQYSNCQRFTSATSAKGQLRNRCQNSTL